VERLAHLLLEERRAYGEWFFVSADEAVDAVQRAMTQVANGWLPEHRSIKAEQAYEAAKRRPGVQMSIRWSDAEIAEIDALRGDTPRAEFVKSFVQPALRINAPPKRRP